VSRSRFGDVSVVKEGRSQGPDVNMVSGRFDLKAVDAHLTEITKEVYQLWEQAGRPPMTNAGETWKLIDGGMRHHLNNVLTIVNDLKANEARGSLSPSYDLAAVAKDLTACSQKMREAADRYAPQNPRHQQIHRIADKVDQMCAGASTSIPQLDGTVNKAALAELTGKADAQHQSKTSISLAIDPILKALEHSLQRNRSIAKYSSGHEKEEVLAEKALEILHTLKEKCDNSEESPQKLHRHQLAQDINTLKGTLKEYCKEFGKLATSPVVGASKSQSIDGIIGSNTFDDLDKIKSLGLPGTLVNPLTASSFGPEAVLHVAEFLATELEKIASYQGPPLTFEKGQSQLIAAHANNSSNNGRDLAQKVSKAHEEACQIGRLAQEWIRTGRKPKGLEPDAIKRKIESISEQSTEFPKAYENQLAKIASERPWPCVPKNFVPYSHREGSMRRQEEWSAKLAPINRAIQELLRPTDDKLINFDNSPNASAVKEISAAQIKYLETETRIHSRKDQECFDKARDILENLHKKCAEPPVFKPLGGLINHDTYAVMKDAAAEIRSLSKESGTELKGQLSLVADLLLMEAYNCRALEVASIKDRKILEAAKNFVCHLPGDELSSSFDASLGAGLSGLGAVSVSGTISASHSEAVNKDSDGSPSTTISDQYGISVGAKLKIEAYDERNVLNLSAGLNFKAQSTNYHEHADSKGQFATLLAQVTEPGAVTYHHNPIKELEGFLEKTLDSANVATHGPIDNIRKVKNFFGSIATDPLIEAHPGMASIKNSKGFSYAQVLERIPDTPSGKQLRAAMERHLSKPDNVPVLSTPIYALKGQIDEKSLGGFASLSLNLFGNTGSDSVFEEKMAATFGLNVSVGAAASVYTRNATFVKEGSAENVLAGTGESRKGLQGREIALNNYLRSTPALKEYVDDFGNGEGKSEGFVSIQSLTQNATRLLQDNDDFKLNAEAMFGKLSLVLDNFSRENFEHLTDGAYQEIKNDISVIAGKFTPSIAQRLQLDIDGDPEKKLSSLGASDQKNQLKHLMKCAYTIAGHAHAAQSLASFKLANDLAKYSNSNELTEDGKKEMFACAGKLAIAKESIDQVGISTANAVDIVRFAPVRVFSGDMKQHGVKSEGSFSVQMTVPGLPHVTDSDGKDGPIHASKDTVIGKNFKPESILNPQVSAKFTYANHSYSREHVNPLRSGSYVEHDVICELNARSLHKYMAGSNAEVGIHRMATSLAEEYIRNSPKFGVGDQLQLTKDRDFAHLRDGFSAALSSMAEIYKTKERLPDKVAFKMSWQSHEGKFVASRAQLSLGNGISIPVSIPVGTTLSVSANVEAGNGVTQAQLPSYGDSVLAHTLFRDQLSLLDKLDPSDPKSWRDKLSDSDKFILERTLFSEPKVNFDKMMKNFDVEAPKYIEAGRVLKLLDEIPSASALKEAYTKGQYLDSKSVNLDQAIDVFRSSAFKEMDPSLVADLDDMRRRNVSARSLNPNQLEDLSARLKGVLVDALKNTKSEYRLLADIRLPDENIRQVKDILSPQKKGGSAPLYPEPNQEPKFSAAANDRMEYYLNGHGAAEFSRYLKFVRTMRDANAITANTPAADPSAPSWSIQRNALDLAHA
jgi:hypothetical protein